MKKILITGGHLTPALAVIEKLDPEKWDIVYVGRKYALESDKVDSQEQKAIEQRKVKFISLISGRLQRHLSLKIFLSLLKIPFGFAQGAKIITTEKPDVVLSFGGYLALPIVIMAKIFSISVVTHEQTMICGLANRMISYFADKICISWKTTSHLFPKSKTVYTGNPIRKCVFTIKQKFSLNKNFPTLYITGGNLGSHSINSLIKPIIVQLLEKFNVIHQTGDTKQYQDFENLSELRQSLPKNLRERYLLFKYIDDDLIGFVLQKSDFLISRSGANTICEIIALERPAILIPLPWSGNGEQEQHARFLASKSAAVLLEQKNLTSEVLLEQIEKAFVKRKVIQSELKKLKNLINPHAADEIIKVVETIITKHKS